jgi:hypothetical protein
MFGISLYTVNNQLNSDVWYLFIHCKQSTVARIRQTLNFNTPDLLLSDAIIRYQYVYTCTVQSYTWLRNEQSISVITVNLAGMFPGLSLENLQNYLPIGNP